MGWKGKSKSWSGKGVCDRVSAGEKERKKEWKRGKEKVEKEREESGKEDK